MATKKSVVHLSTGLQNFGTDSVDANAARHINRSTCHKPIECAVGGGGTGTAPDRITVGHTAGHRKGPAVIHVVETFKHQVDLR